MARWRPGFVAPRVRARASAEGGVRRLAGRRPLAAGRSSLSARADARDRTPRDDLKPSHAPTRTGLGTPKHPEAPASRTPAHPQYRTSAPVTTRHVSRAMSSSSSVGITQTARREPSRSMRPSCPSIAAFLSGSSVDARASPVPRRSRANLRRVLADAAGEDDRVRAVHRGQVRAEVLLDAIAEHVDRETCAAVVVLVLLGQQLAHVVREAGQPEQSRLLVEHRVQLVQRQPLLRRRRSRGWRGRCRPIACPSRVLRAA